MTAVGLFALAVDYRTDISRARARVATGSRMVETACGPIEYAVVGDGPPVLAIHGAGGGYDQGLDIADPIVRAGFQVIAMSRFGYLRTPLPADASPAAQADAHACLLDALHVGRAAVVAASAGAPSAIQLAIRHPDRVSALALLVPGTYPTHLERRTGAAIPERASRATTWMIDAALRSDFVFWLAPRLAREPVLRFVLGTPIEVVDRANAGEQARVKTMLDHLLPMSARRQGLLNDTAIMPALPPYDLERISAPTLIVSAADDLYGTWDGARYTAERIRAARFIGYDTGGHMLVGHHTETTTALVGFLKDLPRAGN